MTSCGFNTFCTANCLDLVLVLIESVLSFSQYPITVNCIDFTYDFQSDRVQSRTIHSDYLYNLNCIYKYKWSTLLESPYENTLMLDADMIVLPLIDTIFTENYSKLTQSTTPLFAKHPHNPFDNPMHKDSLFYMMKMFTSNMPAMNYVYASGLVHQSHRTFLTEMVSAIGWFIANKINPYIEDEGILNCLLSKYQINNSLDYNYFPNATLADDYIGDKLDYSQELYNTYLRHSCPVKFYALHGCKNAQHIKNILHKIVKKNQRETI